MSHTQSLKVDDPNNMGETSSISSAGDHSDAPPPYTDGAETHSSTSTPLSFTATTHLQIDAHGVTFTSSLSSHDPAPIHVYRITTGSIPSGTASKQLQYISLRLKASSNSSALVLGAKPQGPPVNATIYRWGPGRHPRIRLLSPDSSISVEEAISEKDLDCEIVEVRSRSMFSRDQIMATPFGTFRWRYGRRAERKEAYNANSLLILELVEEAPRTADAKKIEDKTVRVAQLVRNDEFRTPGTTKNMAGNGGRLMMNLEQWRDRKGISIVEVEAFVVAGCICMLKKERDRMRDNSTAVIV